MGVRKGFIAAVLACLVGALALLCAAGPSLAASDKPLRGVALIIGNGDYEHLSPLANPPDDARAIEDLFDELGFETSSARDADARKLKRAVERFVEDAEGADAAVVYYAGHGIEAAGENWLIPTDADLSSLDNAAETLVPLSRLMQDLSKVVPLTIVLLDACRDNPFPPGTTVRTAPDAAPAPVSAAGLGETRSVARFGATSATGPGQENFGALIGFAAEPGKVALDGEAGTNSPYAGAVLRHVSAMTGEEFGTVMRMVAEEVYLKTGGRQRPWVNESLRRLLYFGSAPDPVEGEEGDILKERRQLLLTIAALPDAERRQVESVAREGGVPMDAVYGMLRALGQDAPKDPAELTNLLREQTAKIAEMRKERAVIANSDPEILRLSELAARAISEGALETAIGLHEQAKARVREIEDTVETVEAEIKARRIEFADVYARSGETSFMTFDYEQSARDYEKAFEQVERWDDWSAWSHRGNQAVALQASGWRGGKTDHLRQAAVLAREIVQRAERLPDRADWATSQTFLGNTLVTLGQRENDVAMLKEAAAAYEAALTVYAEGAGFDDMRTDVLHNLAGTLFQIGAKQNDAAVLRTAIDRFAELARMVPRAQDAEVWARTVSVQASAMTDLARLGRDETLLDEALSLYRQALEIRRQDVAPEQWAETSHRMAVAMSDLGALREDVGLMREADTVFLSVIAAVDRAKSPVNWSDALQSAGANAHSLAIESGDTAGLERAVGFYRQALEVRMRDTLPDLWADTMTSMGGALCDLGRLRKDLRVLQEGIAAHNDAAEVMTRQAAPGEWSRIQSFIGDATRVMGDIEHSIPRIAGSMEIQAAALSAAVAAGDAARADSARTGIVNAALSIERMEDADGEAVMTALHKAAALLSDGKSAGALASVDTAIGRVLYARAVSASDPVLFEKSIEAYRKALVSEARVEPHRTWSNTQANLALALREFARLPAREHLRAEAVEAWRRAQDEQTDDALWIDNQRSLATLLDELGASGDVGRLREAADAWGALAERLPQSDRTGRASAVESRGLALQNAAYYTPGGDEAALESAAIAYRAALAGYDMATNAEDWRRVTVNLAELRLSVGLSRNDAAALEEAADLFRALDGPARRGGQPLEAERFRAKLASALSARAAISGDSALLNEAIGIFRGVFSPDPGAIISQDWSLGVTFAQALRSMGHSAADASAFQESATLLASVARLPPTALDPQNRAFVRLNEGDTLLALGDLTEDAASLRRAVAAYREADAFYTPEAFPAFWRETRGALANALLTLGTKAGDTGALSEAAGIYRALLAATARKEEAAMWAGFANGLAWGLTQQARHGDAVADAQEAAHYARDALDVFRGASLPLEAAQAQDTLCGAMTELGRMRRDPVLAEEALAACDAALAVFRERKLTTLVRYGEESRARAAALRTELGR